MDFVEYFTTLLARGNTDRVYTIFLLAQVPEEFSAESP